MDRDSIAQSQGAVSYYSCDTHALIGNTHTHRHVRLQLHTK